MSNKVSTVRIVDTRIEPQPPPVYATTIGPVQNQFYKIPASGLSNSYITFNNLTTLGADRAYLDTFEIEITADITFTAKSLTEAGLTQSAWDKYIADRMQVFYSYTSQIPPTKTGMGIPARHLWTFDSFPFNKVCEEIRVNINGGAFFSSPLSYLTAKERYWDEDKISKSYGGICPCHKACMQNEVGLNSEIPDCTVPGSLATSSINLPKYYAMEQTASSDLVPNRTCQQSAYNKTASGVNSSTNSSHVPEYQGVLDPEMSVTITVTWREPIFASPFSSKIDATYGRPLYNITSIDIAMNMMDLRNMLRVIDPLVGSYDINLTSCNLCYQVETVPTGIAPPLTVTPYRRFVPYITDFKGSLPADKIMHMKSGVYTMNEVPTAIWIFAGPTKAMLQTYQNDYFRVYNPDTPSTTINNYTTPSAYNKTFGFIQDLSITLANTTQILSTATPQDLFRICKANGLQDAYENWGMNKKTRNTAPKFLTCSNAGAIEAYWSALNNYYCPGVGSVLRLIPGTDLVIPDQKLVPGANANNLVFTVEASFSMPDVPAAYRDKFALWILFEYVGVATITPGQCEITMNPLGNGAVINTAPVVSATATEEPSTTEGSGFIDDIGNMLKKGWNFIKDNKLISKVGAMAGMLPHPIAQGIGQAASMIGNALGAGVGPLKRPRLTGGATMGLGDFI